MVLCWILRWWRLRQTRGSAEARDRVEKSEIGDNGNGKDDPEEGEGSSASSGSGRASSSELRGSPASGGIVPPNVEIINYGGRGPNITCSQH